MRADVDTVSHFHPRVIVAELLKVLTAGLTVGHVHSHILSLLQEKKNIRITICSVCFRRKSSSEGKVSSVGFEHWSTLHQVQIIVQNI